GAYVCRRAWCPPGSSSYWSCQACAPSGDKLVPDAISPLRSEPGVAHIGADCFPSLEAERARKAYNLLFPIESYPSNIYSSPRREGPCLIRNCGRRKTMGASSGRTLGQDALEVHAQRRPGRLEIVPTKSLTTQRDLSLAYSPGVAEPCLKIQEDPSKAYDYAAKGNLVAIISNGTAVLGLGNLGALASKPVMEGKAVLFKRFADVDGIDLEISTEDVEEFINCVRFLGATFGGINLEDIKAPDCFIIEERLKELLDIPVFHDDQHGTAIIAAA